jgi:hypothetical protein
MVNIRKALMVGVLCLFAVGFFVLQSFIVEGQSDSSSRIGGGSATLDTQDTLTASESAIVNAVTPVYVDNRNWFTKQWDKLWNVDPAQEAFDSWGQSIVDEVNSQQFSVDHATLILVQKTHDETQSVNEQVTMWIDNCTFIAGSSVVDGNGTTVVIPDSWLGCYQTTDNYIDNTTTIIDSEWQEIIGSSAYIVPDDQWCVDQPDSEQIICVSIPHCIGIDTQEAKDNALQYVADANGNCQNQIIPYKLNDDGSINLIPTQPSYYTPTVPPTKQEVLANNDVRYISKVLPDALVNPQ